jgi:uncharacterized protein (TIGR00730 family)
MPIFPVYSATMKRITVFCGSVTGHDTIYQGIARDTGIFLARKNVEVVYGGSRAGLMGAVANGALSVGGKVIGVLPRFLQERELAHTSLTELILVDNMHERKALLNDLSDGFISLPGSIGTMEELFEILTWAQLGLHRKPVALLNFRGFYDSLIALLDHMVTQGFLKASNRELLLVGNDLDELYSRMSAWESPISTSVMHRNNI